MGGTEPPKGTDTPVVVVRATTRTHFRELMALKYPHRHHHSQQLVCTPSRLLIVKGVSRCSVGCRLKESASQFPARALIRGKDPKLSKFHDAH